MNFDPVWRASAPYLRVRKNDIHVPISFDFADRLLEEHPAADALIVGLAILLHDNGWHAIDEADILSKGFGENWRQSDVRFLHEAEGCRIAEEILRGLDYGDGVITRVRDIIDGHDTRVHARSLEDELVRDADKLWRFTPTGIGIACGWFKRTPSAYADDLIVCVRPELHTDAARRVADAELAHSRRLLRIGPL